MNKTIKYSLACLVISSAFSVWYYSLNASESNPIPNIECWYKSKFEQCVVANRNWNARWIDEFPCAPTQDYNLMLDQIILDDLFKETQEKSIAFIDWLEADKELVVSDPNRVVDDITKTFWVNGTLYNEYKEACNWWILSERLECTGWKIPIEPAWIRVAGWWLQSECMSQANTHLNLASLVAYDIAKLNKSTVINDEHKKYFQQERTKYDEILSTMWQILGHTERINPTHVTQDPIQ